MGGTVRDDMTLLCSDLLLRSTALFAFVIKSSLSLPKANHTYPRIPNFILIVEIC